MALVQFPGWHCASPGSAPLFELTVEPIGRFTVHPLRLPDDVALLHRWLRDDHARFWGMQHCDLAAVGRYCRALAASGHAAGYLGCCDGGPAFFMESYDPQHEAVGACYPVAPGDRGMHVLTAPPLRPVHGFTRAVMHVILSFLFAEPAVRRVVVEPDVRNGKIHVLNRQAGFEYQQQIALPGKLAWLAFCRRERFCANLESPA